MFVLICTIIAFLVLFILLTYPSQSNAKRLHTFLKNTCLTIILFINISLLFAVTRPFIETYFSGLLQYMIDFWNNYIIEPSTKFFGLELTKLTEVITFIPNSVSDFIYRELSIHDGEIFRQILLISVSIAILSLLDITTKIFFVENHNNDVNHRFLCITNFVIIVLTCIALLLSVVFFLPYYYELNEIIVITPGDMLY